MRIDFEEIKRKTPIENVIVALGLELKKEGQDQLRGTCPVCQGDDRTLVITFPHKFYCHKAKVGGSVLDLVMHIKQMTLPEAGRYIEREINSPSPPEKKKEAEPKAEASPPSKFDPEAYYRTLDPNHELVDRLGWNEERCRQFKAGVSQKGVHKGRLAIRLIGEDGEIVFASVGMDGVFKFPKVSK